MTEPNLPGRSIIQAAKKQEKKTKKENQMKTTTSNKKTVIFSVLATLAALATIIGLVYAGMRLERHNNNQIDARVHAELKSISSAVTPSKQ